MKLRYLILVVFMITCNLAFAVDPWGTPAILTGSETVMAKVSINSVPAVAGDVLAAFVYVDDYIELRGKEVILVNGGIAGCLLQIYTESSGEQISFKVWDESAQDVVSVTPILSSEVGAIVGHYPENPYLVNAITIMQTVATPTFSPEPGLYQNFADVSLSCGTVGAQIRYTLDASEPSAASSLYSQAIHLTQTTLIRARAFLDGWLPSPLTEALYDIAVASPEADLTPIITGIRNVYPNPFSNHTTIQLAVKEANQPYSMKVYNIKGACVYGTEGIAIGNFELHWNGYSSDGKRLPSGIYLISFNSGETRQTRKLVLQ